MSIHIEHDSHRMLAPKVRRAIAVWAVLFAASVLVWLAERARGGVAAPAIDRTSYAIGFSAGAGFRDVIPVSLDDFRQGVLDGLGGERAHERVMRRPEFFAEVRRLMKRLSDAELAAVGARIDRDSEH